MSLRNFIILNFITFGIYSIWWIYKSWRFFKEKDNLDIIPAARAIFAIFFLYYLFDEIQDYARSKGYDKEFSSMGSFLGFIAFNFASKFPDPYWLVSFFAFMFLIPAFNALNFGILNSENYNAIEKDGFNTRQIGLLVIGGLLWSLFLIGMFAPDV